jgi:hypothetical protein
MKKLVTVGLVATALTCANGARADVVIDPFDMNGPTNGGNTFRIDVGGVTPFEIFDSFDSSGILGDQREVTLRRELGEGGVSESIAVVFGGADGLSFATDGGTKGSLRLVWDGDVDGGTSGAQGVHHDDLFEDLTVGGNKGIVFKGGTDSSMHTLTLDVFLWSTAANKSKASFSISTNSQADADLQTFFAPWGAFTPVLGYGAADPSQVTAIEMYMEGTADTDARILPVSAAHMPEPGSMALLATGALPLLRTLRRRRAAKKSEE